MTKLLDDNILNFVNGGLLINPRRLEKKKLEIYLKRSKYKKKEIVEDEKNNLDFNNN